MRSHAELKISSRHVLGVLLANAVVWAAAILVSRNFHLGGAAAVALISISSLLSKRSG